MGTRNGNSIEQYQAWARGTLKVTEKSSILIQIHGVTTFFINQQRYSGDYYNHKTTSHFVEIDKGTHTLDVRIIHGMKSIPIDIDKEKHPSCHFSITIHPLESDITMDHHQLKHHHHYQLNTELLGREMIKHTLMPSFLLDHGFAGNLGSITIQNLTPDILRVVSIRLVIQAYHQTADVITIMRPTCLVQRSNHITLVKGQQRQIGFNFDLRNVHNPTFLQAENIKVKIIVSMASSVTTFNLVDEISMNSISWNESSIFRYTFLDYDKSVQYAVAKRPTILDDDINKPIILALHSASSGIEPLSSWTDHNNSQKSIWVIFATGRTTCENDWQGRSVKNAFSAVDELANVLELLFQGSDFKPPVDDSDWIVVEKRGSFSIGNTKKIIYIGYNHGGQGVWYLLTHYPDRAIGAIDIDGYKSYQNSGFSYNSLCYIDPLLYGTMEMAYTDFNIGLHLPNMVGVPILTKYKPNAHTTFPLQAQCYARLLNEYYKNPNLVKLSLDKPIQNYNWNSVFNNDDINNYLTTLVNDAKQISNKKDKFSVVTTNPATIGQIQGVQIEQLHIPFRKSQLDGYAIDNNTLILTSKNISAFTITNRKETIIIIDGTRVQRHCSNSSILLVKYGDDWMVEKGKWPPRLERSRLTYGPIHRMYESSKPILIIIPSKNRITSSASSASTVYNIYQHIALQLAHDWHNYGTGDMIIVSDDHPLVSYEEIDLDDNTEPYFRIYLGVGDDNHALNQLLKNESSVDVKLEPTTISVGNKKFSSPGSGIIFMCPGNNLNEIAVVLSGLDLNGLKTCSYLFPKRTDHLLPEWIVVNSLTNWQTLGGILSAGFFNNRWKAYGY
ncbi:unnamed protein product [Cunninghamella echinulata]